MESFNTNTGASTQGNSGGLPGGFPNLPGGAPLAGSTGAPVDNTDNLAALESLFSDTTTSGSAPDYLSFANANTSLSSTFLPSLQTPKEVSQETMTATTALLTNFGATPVTQQKTLSLVQALIKNSVNTQTDANVTVDNPKIVAYATSLGLPPAQVQDELQTRVNNSVEQQLSKLPDGDALLFAFFNPDNAKNLTPEQQATLNKAIANANTQVATFFGLESPLTGVPVNSEEFQKQLSDTYSNNFTQAVNNLVANGSISAEEGQQLLSMFYLPDSTTPLSPQLQNTFQGLQQQIILQMQQQYSTGAAWQPTANVSLYNDLISSNFVALLQENIVKYQKSNKVSDADSQNQMDLIMQYLEDPTNPAIPDNIKQLASTLIGQTTKTIIAQYGLVSSWQATVDDPQTVNVARIANSQNVLNTALDFLNTAEKTISQLPDSPEKGVYLAYLKTICSALITLQNSLYSIQTGAGNINKTLSNLTAAVAKANLEVQAAALKKVQADQGKMADLPGWLGTFLKVIMIVVLVVMAFFAPPPADLIIAAVAIDMIYETAGGKDGLISGLNQLAKLGGGGAAWGEIIAAIAAVAVIAVTLGTAGIAVIMALAVVYVQTDITKDAALRAGASKTEATMTQMLVSVVIMVALMFVAFGAGMGTVAENSTAIINAGTSDAVDTFVAAKVAVAEFLSSYVSMQMRVAMGLVLSALQVTTNGIQMNNNILLAEITMIKGNAEAYAAEIEGLISVLKKLIEQLLAKISDVSEWVGSVGRLFGSINQSLINASTVQA